MKKIFLILSMAFCFSSCNDFLETESYTTLNSGNFPAEAGDIQDLITGAYSTQTSWISAWVCSHPYFVSELASDERLGGCGSNSWNVQCLDKMMTSTVDDHSSFWSNRYKGVYRANMVIETIDRCTGFTSDEEKNHMLGEAHFLRALFYWELGQLFENIPMPLYTTDYNLTQVSPDVLFGQIATDFIKAIDLLERNKFDSTKSGIATVWAAEAYLARVFLFYTGFYQKDSMPLNDGEELTKSEMIAYLDDCIDNSGHGLVSDFRNLWAYSNDYTAEDWDYAKENNLSWEGDNNKEIMYSYKFGLKGGSSVSYRNFFVIWQGLPTKMVSNPEKLFPYGFGWAMGSVCPDIWNTWQTEEPDDIRRMGSIISLEDETPAYVPTDGTGGWDSWEETYYRSKKFMNVTSVSGYNDDGSIATVYNTFTYEQYGANNNYLTGQITDFPLLRFADVLLMHSELSQTADGMNQVRARAGLDPVTYSLENIQKERRWELSFEGVRWNDIRRWHIATDVLGNQAGLDVLNRGAVAVVPSDLGGGYVARYNATRGFWNIPDCEIKLSNGVMIQNEGWREGDNYLYTGWS
ncbi:MAG: RagB/SusD family nutrient uptake outer membrane protein [Rikenellaceae bacterium]